MRPWRWNGHSLVHRNLHEGVGGHEQSSPVRAKTSKAADVFYIRMNNSTRELPMTGVAAEGFTAYCADRWPDRTPS